jgi:hypothetical protein
MFNKIPKRNLPISQISSLRSLRKDKRTTTIKREEGKPSCIHCKKNGHDDEHYWKLHPEKRLK